jgi:hypothetical protein
MPTMLPEVSRQTIIGQCKFRMTDILQLQAKSQSGSDGIKTKLRINRSQSLHQCHKRFPTFSIQRFKNFLSDYIRIIQIV